MPTKIDEKGLTRGMVQLCVNDLSDWGGITMSFDQVKEIVDKEEPLVEYLLKYYVSVEDDTKHGLDTADRDLLFDSFARNIAECSHWPLYRDTPEYSADFVKAVSAARDAGKIEAFSKENLS